ncbi:MAG: glycosyltransferase [Planctomycetota bacterium]
MESSPRISVIVPVYNGEDVIGICLDALATQTVEHEVVVVNDRSTDGTVGVVENYDVRLVEGEGRAEQAAAAEVPLVAGSKLPQCDAGATCPVTVQALWGSNLARLAHDAGASSLALADAGTSKLAEQAAPPTVGDEGF